MVRPDPVVDVNIRKRDGERQREQGRGRIEAHNESFLPKKKLET